MEQVKQQDKKKFAFVPPRCGQSIGGGAETLMLSLASQVAKRGHEIEIWTTCAKDNRTWKNEYEPGLSEEKGIQIQRFLVDDRDLDIWVPHQIHLHQGMQLPVEEQLDWMQHGVNSSALYTHIAENADFYDAILFAPYLFGTTFWGSQIRPDKSILIPCLHDEVYAYVDVVASMFRNVRGCLFNAQPEEHLAKSLYGELAGGVVGMGFDFPKEEEVKELLPYFKEDFSYLLYVGRKETGKNVQLVVDNFISGKDSRAFAQELKLVIVGGGDFKDLERPDALRRDDVVDLNHVSEEDKQRLIKRSLCLVQPSTNESFSIVIMEAWLLGVPVVVHSDCAVTKHHVLESGGGLHFRTREEFIEVISVISGDPELCSNLSSAGMNYVHKNYNWESVISRFDEVTKNILTLESSSLRKPI